MRRGGKARNAKPSSGNGSSDEATTKSSTNIQLSVLGGKAQSIGYTDGMTVGDLLKKAGVTLADGQLVAVEGHKADMDTVIKAGAVVTITSAIKNG